MYLEKLRLDGRVAVVTGGGGGIGLACATALAAGPSTSSSRVGAPTRKRSTSPEWTPTDIDRAKRPADVGTAAARRREARISTAASQACSGWSSPWRYPWPGQRWSGRTGLVPP